MSNGQRGIPIFSLYILCLTVLIVLVVLPLVSVFWGASNLTSPVMRDTVLTMDHWREAYTTERFLDPLVNTLKLSIIVTIIAVSIGTFFAWLMSRTNMPLRSKVEPFIITPFFLSPFIGAMAWVALAAPNSGILNVYLFGKGTINIFSFGGIIWAMVLYYIPYAYMVMIGAFGMLDPALEESSRMCGGGIAKTFFRVVLPLCSPAVLAAFMLIFVMSSEMFSIPSILGTQAKFHTLAYAIYYTTQASPPQWPQAAAAGTILMWIAGLGIFIYQRFTRLGYRFVTVTGKSYKPKLLDIGWFKYIGLSLILIYIFISVILPYGALFFASLTRYSGEGFTLKNMTLQNYAFFKDSLFHRSLINTAMLALGTSVFIILLGVITSYLVHRSKISGRNILDSISTIPIAVPGVVFGIGLLWTYFAIPLPIYGTIIILALAYLARYLPQAYRIVNASLLQLHPDMEQSARLCGATPMQSVFHILIPILKHPMLGAWLISIILIIRDIDTVIIVYSPNSIVLPVLLWEMMSSGWLQSAYAMALFQTALLLLVIFIAKFLFKIELIRKS